MKDIRTIQSMYLSMNGRYCSTFDSLITFVKEGKMPIVKLTARPRTQLLLTQFVIQLDLKY